MTQRIHPFPYRTRKLSSAVLMILGGRLPGKVSRRRIFNGGVAQLARANGSYPLGRWFESTRRYHFVARWSSGPRLRPLTAATRVRISYGSPLWATKEKKIVGVYSDEGPPVPIPNTAVKLISAENTWGAAPWEDRATPTFFLFEPQ